MGKLEDLIVYQKAYSLAVQIFLLASGFPSQEKTSLTSQITRSSRSVCSNLAEGYRKRRYLRYFKNKLTEADSEITETIVWINFSFDCGYINQEKRDDLLKKADEVSRLLSFMIKNPQRFIGDPGKL